jgi:hypothetical protein
MKLFQIQVFALFVDRSALKYEKGRYEIMVNTVILALFLDAYALKSAKYRSASRIICLIRSVVKLINTVNIALFYDLRR